MPRKAALFAMAFVLGFLCSPGLEASRAPQAASCLESDVPHGAGLRSFCRRAEGVAALPLAMQFAE
jgi:hypothetical protein